MTNYRYATYAGIRVAWLDDLDGGGRAFGQQHLHAVRCVCGPVDRAYEFCAGPGFIGFSLLAHGLCNTLCLSDINPKAVDAMKHTVALNGLQDRVSVYHSDGLDDIPDREQWDVVVSNPPHFDGPQSGLMGLRTFDPGWRIHARFFAQVRRDLTPHAQILMQENSRGSTEQTFLPMLEHSGLEFVGSLMLKKQTPDEIETGYPRSPESRQTITIRAGDDQGGVVADDHGNGNGNGSSGADTEHVSPLNFYYFFCARVKHDELVWVSTRPSRDVDLVLNEAGAVVCREAAADDPLRLPIGQPYAVCLGPGTLGPSRPERPLRVTCLPTGAVSVIDGGSGRRVIEFG